MGKHGCYQRLSAFVAEVLPGRPMHVGFASHRRGRWLTDVWLGFPAHLQQGLLQSVRKPVTLLNQ